MNHMKNIILVTVGLWTITQTTVQAQPDKKDIFSEDYDVYTSYKPKVTDAIKMDIIQVNEKMDLLYPVIKYEVFTSKFEPEKIETKLPAIKLVKRKTRYLDHFYAIAGAGNYNNLLADLTYNTTNMRNMAFAAHGNFNNGVSTPKKSNLMEESLDLKGKFFRMGKTFYSSAYLHNQGLHFFGYNPDSIDFDADSIRQNFFNTGIYAGFNNALDNKAKISFDVKTGFYNLSDKFGNSEFGSMANGFIEQDFRGNPIHFEAKYNFYRLGQNNYNWIRNTLDIIANYNISQDFWQLRAGFDIATENDSNHTKSHFYPDLRLDAFLFDKNLNIYGGLGGGLRVNTFSTLTEINPFVNTGILEFRNTNDKIALYAGVQGHLNDILNYKLDFNYKTTKNYMLYVNDSSDMKKFTVIYDTGNTSVTTLTAEIASIDIVKNLDIFVKGEYFITDLSVEAATWHEPDYQLKLSVKYDIENKINLSLDYFFIGPRPVKTWDNAGNEVALSLPAINDLNLGINYRFSRMFTVFFNFNNILTNKYSYWYNYELRGFHFLGGAKVSF